MFSNISTLDKNDSNFSLFLDAASFTMWLKVSLSSENNVQLVFAIIVAFKINKKKFILANILKNLTLF